MKKLLVSCGMAMLLLLCSATVWGAKTGESYFADNFENKTDWESLALTEPYWESSNGGGVTVSEDGKPGNGKCAVVKAHWGSSLDVVSKDPFAGTVRPLTGTVGISFDMMMNKRSVDGVYLLNSDKSQSQNWLLKFEWQNQAYEVYPYTPVNEYNPWTTAPLFTIQQNQWVNIKMILDVPNNQYSVWITGEDGVSKNILFNAPIPFDSTFGADPNVGVNTGFNGLRFFYAPYAQYGVPETEIGDFKLDNFDMYEDSLEEYEDFEQVSTFAELQPQWWSDNAGPLTIEDEQTSEGQNHFLQFKSLYASEVVDYFPAVQAGNLFIEFRVKTEGGSSFLRMRDDKNVNYPTILNFSAGEDGTDTVTYSTGGESVSYKRGEWVKIRIVIDREANKWYGSLISETDDNEQAIFNADLPVQTVTGIQFGYPGDSGATMETAKAFCLDDLRVTAFSNDDAYRVTASAADAQGSPISDAAGLLEAKDQNPQINMTVTRESLGEMAGVYACCVLYQDGRLVSISFDPAFALGATEREKTVAVNLDCSKLDAGSEDVEIKAFLWQGNNLVPLAEAFSVFGK